MTKHFYFSLFAFLLFVKPVFSQKKTLQTQFTDEKIAIDGKLDEKSWQTAAIATDFVMIAPSNGKPISDKKRTEVKIAYDNNAIYIAANLYDDQPDSILKELTARDVFGTTDVFGVFLNGYDDGQHEFRFYVSAAGVQSDCQYTVANGEDFLWNAIWESNFKITETGWTVEMRIPFAALRFSIENKKTWGLNFYREIRSERQQYSWNLLDAKIANECTQAGTLQGIENINTPTRLFFIPYSSEYVYANKNQKTYGEPRGGMDIKYGITDAFTLDAVLIPDFGQTKFDNVELNLSAFEQKFNENRPFFTEGTDLFSKGNLFYSRRIGQSPSLSLASNEMALDKSGSIKLINALKISGRTKNGFGIGVLNAISENTMVSIKNNDTNEIKREILSPLTNYNILVLDQRFNKNSSVSFVNTSVTRNGSFKDANVSALVWDLNTKGNTFNLSGDFKSSLTNNAFLSQKTNGISSSLNFGKTKGKYNCNIGGLYVSRDYDINDLGINYQTHYHSLYSNSSYKILKPTRLFNYFQTSLTLSSDFENRTGRIQSNLANFNINIRTKYFNYYGITVTSSFLKTYDFYEPRSINQANFVTIPENYKFSFYYSSNYNKRFAIDIKPNYSFYNSNNRIDYGFVFSPRYRFNDHLSLIYNLTYTKQNNNLGWVDFDNSNNTIFARRDRTTYTNTLQGKYTINSKMNFDLNIRHYWSYAKNNEYLTLQNNGDLASNPFYNVNKNSNLNTWNLDLSYSWWFAPGSQLSILYRNNASLFSREFNKDFESNFKSAIDNQNLTHIFSISIRYFIDYNTVKKSNFYNSFTQPKTLEHF